MEHRPKFSGAAYYQRAIWVARWFCVLIVVLTYPLYLKTSLQIAAFMAAAISFNLIILLLNSRRGVPGTIWSLLADNLFVLLLLAVTGGINSPYFLYLLLIPLISAYWYGIVEIISLLFIDLTLTVFVTALLPAATAMSPTRVLLIQGLSVINIGLLAQRLNRAQRLDRTVALSFGIQVEAEREQLLALVNSMADAVVAVDETGLITLYNGAALDLLNSHLDLKGRPLTKLLPLTDASDRKVDLIAAIAGQPGIIRRRDLVYRTPDGSKMDLYISISPVRPLHNGGQEGYIMTIRDITKEKSLEEQRDEFISVASHELRTPLAIAEANLSTALLPGYDKVGVKARELVELAHQNLVFLGDLIRDLTTIAKIEQGELAIGLERIDPERLLRQLQRDYAAEAKSKGLELVCQIDPDLPRLVTSEARIHEILQNFITNALKYTQKGQVTLRAVPATGKSTGVIFSVTDTGIGISASDQKKLFSKFYRSEDYRTRATGGTGLGLYITLQLAERLGAKVWFESQLNHGSTFYVEVHSSKLPAGSNIS